MLSEKWQQGLSRLRAKFGRSLTDERSTALRDLLESEFTETEWLETCQWIAKAKSETDDDKYLPEPARFVEIRDRIAAARYVPPEAARRYCGECKDGIMSFIRVDFQLSTRTEDEDVQTFRIPGDAELEIGWFHTLRATPLAFQCYESTCSCDCRGTAWALRVDELNSKLKTGQTSKVVPPLYSQLVGYGPSRYGCNAAYMGARAFDAMLREHFKGGAQ